jgi:hypothetical protein
MPKTYKQEFADMQSAWMEAVEQVKFWGDRFDSLYSTAEQDRLDAERYRKLKHELGRRGYVLNTINEDFDAAIDALRMPSDKSNCPGSEYAPCRCEEIHEDCR